jgi:hypothetical protein
VVVDEEVVVVIVLKFLLKIEYPIKIIITIYRSSSSSFIVCVVVVLSVCLLIHPSSERGLCRILQRQSKRRRVRGVLWRGDQPRGQQRQGLQRSVFCERDLLPDSGE